MKVPKSVPDGDGGVVISAEQVKAIDRNPPLPTVPVVGDAHVRPAGVFDPAVHDTETAALAPAFLRQTFIVVEPP